MLGKPNILLSNVIKMVVNEFILPIVLISAKFSPSTLPSRCALQNVLSAKSNNVNEVILVLINSKEQFKFLFNLMVSQSG